MAKLLLIDGNAMLHRAYHALPPLTNSKGEVVNAAYGFFSMLVNVLVDQKPDYLVVCFDKAAPTIRQTMYAGYHAHRPRMADDFVPQVGLVHAWLEKMKVAVFELDGYEGDDLVGTIATEAVHAVYGGQESGKNKEVQEANEKKIASAVKDTSLEVIILTGDRDLLQLVNKHVKVLMPITGITKTALYDEKAVEEKYGVHPSQFVDYKALIGDASDGYPGVTGIGPKTASKLILEYKTFENLYEHVGDLPEKVGLKLATDAEQAALAKKLAKIITDAPIQFDITKAACADFDAKALRETFREQGFKSLTARLDLLFGKEEEQLGLL
jgi:DNA polymerase I